MHSRRPIDAVTEREIDLLLLMMLHCSPGFRAFLASRTAGAGDFEFLGAWRGVFDNLGESDLLALFKDANGQRIAVMIEDKIAAAFQPDQAARYRQRGERGLALDEWDRFVTCLCAPKAYSEPTGKGDTWDAILAYEEIEADLTTRDELFSDFVREALRQGVDKHRVRWLPRQLRGDCVLGTVPAPATRGVPGPQNDGSPGRPVGQRSLAEVWGGNPPAERQA